MEDIGNGYLLESNDGRIALEDLGVLILESGPDKPEMINNYEFVNSVSAGIISVTEKIR